jgi:U3 small nucleolar RNA-associated protein 25
MQDQTTLQNDFLQVLNGYHDLYHPSVLLDNHKILRETLALHALNHITK